MKKKADKRKEAKENYKEVLSCPIHLTNKDKTGQDSLMFNV